MTSRQPTDTYRISQAFPEKLVEYNNFSSTQFEYRNINVMFFTAILAEQILGEELNKDGTRKR